MNVLDELLGKAEGYVSFAWKLRSEMKVPMGAKDHEKILNTLKARVGDGSLSETIDSSIEFLRAKEGDTIDHSFLLMFPFLITLVQTEKETIDLKSCLIFILYTLEDLDGDTSMKSSKFADELFSVTVTGIYPPMIEEKKGKTKARKGKKARKAAKGKKSL